MSEHNDPLSIQLKATEDYEELCAAKRRVDLAIIGLRERKAQARTNSRQWNQLTKQLKNLAYEATNLHYKINAAKAEKEVVTEHFMLRYLTRLRGVPLEIDLIPQELLKNPNKSDEVEQCLVYRDDGEPFIVVTYRGRLFTCYEYDSSKLKKIGRIFNAPEQKPKPSPKLLARLWAKVKGEKQ